ncbi:MAG: CAAX prenyl protease-related protein [Pirellulales bacterium]
MSEVDPPAGEPEVEVSGGAAQERPPRTQTPDGLPLGPKVFGPWAWITVILPLIVYLCGNTFGGYLEGMRVEHVKKEEAKNGATDPVAADDLFTDTESAKTDVPEGMTSWFQRWFPWKQTWYPSTYTLTIALVTVLILCGLPGYFRAPFRITPWGIGVGILGIVVWLGLWYLDEKLLGLGSLISPFLGGKRSEFNPFEALKDNPTWMYQFLGIRLFGMILVVPLIEEFFIRGFLMRYVDDPDWDQIPLGLATYKAVVGVMIYAAVSHPGELFAAVAWFGLITWLYLKTKNIWDCVIAHSITNALLAVYVLVTKTWVLW